MSCNYANLFSGTLHWRSVMKAHDIASVEDVTVVVKSGKAGCSGTVEQKVTLDWSLTR